MTEMAAQTWIPIYTELAKRLLEFEDQQDELLVFLHELKKAGHKVVPLQDRDGKQPVPLDVIDPFTFFATFTRGVRGRDTLLRLIEEKLGLSFSVPDDFEGLPTVMLYQSWSFPFKTKRKGLER